MVLWLVASLVLASDCVFTTLDDKFIIADCKNSSFDGKNRALDEAFITPDEEFRTLDGKFTTLDEENRTLDGEFTTAVCKNGSTDVKFTKSDRNFFIVKARYSGGEEGGGKTLIVAVNTLKGLLCVFTAENINNMYRQIYRKNLTSNIKDVLFCTADIYTADLCMLTA